MWLQDGDVGRCCPTSCCLLHPPIPPQPHWDCSQQRASKEIRKKTPGMSPPLLRDSGAALQLSAQAKAPPSQHGVRHFLLRRLSPWPGGLRKPNTLVRLLGGCWPRVHLCSAETHQGWSLLLWAQPPQFSWQQPRVAACPATSTD